MVEAYKVWSHRNMQTAEMRTSTKRGRLALIEHGNKQRVLIRML